MSPWRTEIRDSRIAGAARLATCHPESPHTGQPSIVFHDLELMRARCEELRDRFPPQSLHAVAIKANPLVEVLRVLVASGMGLEAASMEEVHLALAAGCPPRNIVYDSPAKSLADLREALDLGVVVNADNVDELQRIDRIRQTLPVTGPIGLRVNPLVGEGSRAITSVATRGSKFGVPLDTLAADPAAIFARFPWLTGLHSHVGSQSCSLEQLMLAASRVARLRDELSARRLVSIHWFDLGGGLPAIYQDATRVVPLEDYVAALRRETPALFQKELRLVTEFGRALQANCGWAISRVEYVKMIQDRPMAVIHLGADFMLRTAYQPELWPHRCGVMTADCEWKTGPRRPSTIAGPLCFAGDILARDVLLPEISPGDWIVIRDVGAYTLSMWSRHCSRGMPLVLGLRGDDSHHECFVLRRRELPQDLVRFWSP